MSREKNGAVTVTTGPEGVTVRCRVHDEYADTDLVVMRTCATEDEARRAVRWELRRTLLAQGVPLISARSTFEMAADAWLAVASPNRSVKVLAAHRLRLRSVILARLGGYRLSEIDAPLLGTFLGYVEEVATPRARSDIRSTVTSVFAFAVRHGALPANPMYDTPPITGVPLAPHSEGTPVHV